MCVLTGPQAPSLYSTSTKQFVSRYSNPKFGQSRLREPTARKPLNAAGLENFLNEKEVAWEQIAFANVILLNKTDLVSNEELNDLEKKVRSINPTAKIFRTAQAEIDLDQILNIRGFDINNVPEDISLSSHPSESGISSVALTFPEPVHPDRLNYWLQMSFLMEGMNVFRGKGILNVENSKNRYLFQSVYMMFEGRFDKPWGEETPENKMVFIGQNLNAERLEKSLKNAIT